MVSLIHVCFTFWQSRPSPLLLKLPDVCTLSSFNHTEAPILEESLRLLRRGVTIWSGGAGATMVELTSEDCIFSSCFLSVLVYECMNTSCFASPLVELWTCDNIPPTHPLKLQAAVWPRSIARALIEPHPSCLKGEDPTKLIIDNLSPTFNS